MRKATIFIVVALLTLGAVPVYAADIPPLPHAFYGTVEINGSPAPRGTTVEARGKGVLTDIEGNPITTNERGKYGSTTSPELDLIVQGDITEGATLTFYVNGHSTSQTYPFDSGETTELPLSVTITAPPPPPPTVETNLFGIEASFLISDEGVIQEEIVATSEDEYVTITIEAGTIALLEGEPLETLTAAVESSPPEPPEGTYLIGAYDFGPDGATFDPPITLTWSYDPETLPEWVDEENLVIAYYDEVNEEWVWVPCEVDTENNIITASVAHFTTFAIIGTVAPPAPAAFTVSSLSISPIEVNVGETVTISLMVTNTGGESGSYTVTLDIDGVEEAEETVTVAAGDSQEVSFSVTKEAAGIYSVTVAQLSSSFTVIAPLAPAAFSVSSLSVLPAEVESNEAVTITVSVANTGGTEGSYTVVLKVNGVKEAEKTVTIAAGDSQEVTFTVAREDAGIYTVAVAQLSGSFVVVAPPGVNWPLIGGVIGGVIVVGLLIFFLVFRRRAY